jgi:hypothetical protein
MDNLGYYQYGQAKNMVSIGRTSFSPAGQPTAPGQGLVPQPYGVFQSPTNAHQSGGVPVTPASSRYGRAPDAAQPRWNFATGRGVLATGSNVPNFAAMQQGAVPFSAGTRGANVINPLFGRPMTSYTYTVPARRFGPAPKLAPGTGLTAQRGSNRAQGFVPAAHATEQYLPGDFFDYTPPTDPNVGPGIGLKAVEIARGIGYGDSGTTLVNLTPPHENTQASRMFTQGRSSAPWQDFTFGPDYRWLLQQQLVAKYNVYNGVRLAGVLNPNAYSLGTVTQPAQAAALGSSGMGRPLGY